jgi:exopolysaccharide biosynthesis predicted pyruvyltransferase EpsI
MKDHRVADLQGRLTAQVAPLLRGFERYALVDFPRHSNVGDSALWLGARRLLDDAGLRPAYVCDYWTYRPEHLARAGDALIVINGGGNLGDLYAKHQALREEILERFPDRPVVQLPQTIHFADPDRLDRAQRIFDRHRALTLLVRDEVSLDRARRWFQAPVELAPDTAFALAGELTRPAPDRAVQWVLRRDRESSFPPPSLPPDAVDWRAEDVDSPALTLTHRLVELVAPLARRAAPIGPVLGRAFDERAGAHLRAGVRVLARGEVVVTDRLHAHLLCLLLGIPHVLLDDRNHKVRTFHDAWTRGAGVVRLADTLDAAAGAAEELRTTTARVA